MKCPIDNTDLVITDRQNIEIDYCPECRGVWLDRGELDKIIERSEQINAPRSSDRYNDDRQSYNKHGDNNGYNKKRRGGFLGELFD